MVVVGAAIRWRRHNLWCRHDWWGHHSSCRGMQSRSHHSWVICTLLMHMDHFCFSHLALTSGRHVHMRCRTFNMLDLRNLNFLDDFVMLHNFNPLLYSHNMRYLHLLDNWDIHTFLNCVNSWHLHSLLHPRDGWHMNLLLHWDINDLVNKCNLRDLDVFLHLLDMG